MIYIWRQKKKIGFDLIAENRDNVSNSAKKMMRDKI